MALSFETGIPYRNPISLYLLDSGMEQAHTKNDLKKVMLTIESIGFMPVAMQTPGLFARISCMNMSPAVSQDFGLLRWHPSRRRSVAGERGR